MYQRTQLNVLYRFVLLYQVISDDIYFFVICSIWHAFDCFVYLWNPQYMWIVGFLASDKPFPTKKIIDIFFLFHRKNISYGHSLELPQCGDSYGHQSVLFLSEKRKHVYTLLPLISGAIDFFCLFYTFYSIKQKFI